MPIELEMMSQPDSWPPTQVRLNPSMSIKKTKGDPRPLLEDIDENPLTYFLTPAPGDDDDMDLDVDMMDFDAGIEDSTQPRETVRSVSPSSLEGLRKPNNSGRATSPDFDSDVPTTDDDDDEEYIRFSSPPRSVLSPLRDLAIEGLRFRPRSPVFGNTANALLSPNSFPAPVGRRGRTNSRGASRRQQTRSLSARARPNHLWREPSPDVWSIEEETEEELMSDMGSEVGVDMAAAKPRKKVRFVLPVKE